MRNECLCFSHGCEVCVVPTQRPVADKFGPVALDNTFRFVVVYWGSLQTYIPCFGAVLCLRYVVLALTMPAHDEEFVLLIRRRTLVQQRDMMFEPLPLGSFERDGGCEFGIGGIVALDEA